tara:strand:- start:4116 stop:5438 length:1323 start_codon:yes stop_codon:yes gene_type:complete
MSIQIERGADDVNLSGIQFVFSKGGNSISEIVYNVPNQNQKKTYIFNLIGLGEPDLISIAPVFENNETGDVTATIDEVIPGDIDEEDPDIEIILPDVLDPDSPNYIGEDCVDEDGDKFNVTAGCGVVDCDDTDATINPEGTEDYNNGVDEDCDGGDNLIECGVLDDEGVTYVLDNDIPDAGGTCFTISTLNLVLDMNGHSITGDGTGGGIIYRAGYPNDITIMNGYIYNFNTGIGLDEVNKVTIEHMTIADNSEYGIFCINDCPFNAVFRHLNISNNEEYGIYSWESGVFYVFENLFVTGNRYAGIRIFSSINVTDSYFSDNDDDIVYGPYLLNVSTDSPGLLTQWYYKARVLDQNGNPVSGATVEAVNQHGDSDLILTTGGNGWTPVGIITENSFIVNVGIDYYSPYTITASKSGFTDATHTDVSINDNTLEDEFVLGS